MNFKYLGKDDVSAFRVGEKVLTAFRGGPFSDNDPEPATITGLQDSDAEGGSVYFKYDSDGVQVTDVSAYWVIKQRGLW